MTNPLLTALCLLIAASVVLGVTPQRPPATPLIACDPYFSVWSITNDLTGSPTRHWTGKEQPLVSLVRIDGHAYRLMGAAPADLPAAHQVSLTVLPTQTRYAFEAGGVQLTLTFMTPLLPDDLMICARPVTYLTWSAKSTTDDAHQVSVYIDASANLAVNTPDQIVVPERGMAGALTTLRIGTVDQPVLEARGDDQRIDWGYFYLAGVSKSAALAPAEAARSAFINTDSTELPADELSKLAAKEAPVPAMTFPLGNVSARPVSAHVLLAYDDLFSIRYFNTDLKAYWTRDGAKIGDLLQTAEKDYATLTKRCEAFDNELMADMKKIGGESYPQIGVLAWRQALAAQKICADASGQPLMFSKENFSNGCISTVDVLYPASPQMIAFSPNMLKASLTPLLGYSASTRWKHDSAPHDLGQYPHATGQVYGGGDSDSGMPVEETGNMLCMLAALAKAEGNADFSRPYWPTLTRWVNYLKEKGLDPENQLTTDDFAGHIARNTNLSAKAIMGIASYGMLADMLGHKEVADATMNTAREYAQKWMKMSADGDHYALVFGDKGKGTWSQKYNLVWDKLLGFNLFPPEVTQKEWAFYRTKMNKYGLPLDSRREYTKIDWELWTATLADKHEDFQALVDHIAVWLDETPDRVPMSDWYETVNGKKSGFQARSVVGGIFIPFLADAELWKKYSSRDKTNAAGWAEVDYAAPKLHVLVPAADTEKATWQYTTDQPGEDWMGIDFNASKWSTGKSGFGTEGTPGARVGTKWNSDNIWLRRSVSLTDGDFHNVRLWLHHDEDAEVYLNGLLAAKQSGFTAEYVMVRISPEALATLKPGKNLIAVHCHQTIAGQYVDVGLVALAKKK